MGTGLEHTEHAIICLSRYIESKPAICASCLILLIPCLLYRQASLGMVWLCLTTWIQEEKKKKKNKRGPQVLKSVKGYVPRNLDFVGPGEMC